MRFILETDNGEFFFTYHKNEFVHFVCSLSGGFFYSIQSRTKLSPAYKSIFRQSFALLYETNEKMFYCITSVVLI